VVDDAPARSRRAALIAITAVLVGLLVVRSGPLAREPAQNGPYGSGIGTDGLANTQIGGTSSDSPNLRTAFRFRATETGPLNTIRVYLVDGEGYAGGTGGTISVSVRPDAGAPNHVPSKEVLATTTVTPGNPIAVGNLPLITFPSPASLVAGVLYDIVFENVDEAPRVNFVSINSLWTEAVTQPRQPAIADLDWAQLIDPGSGWSVRPDFTPILDLGYADGGHAGVGYIEVWVKAARQISGANAIREVFTPSADRIIRSASVRLQRLSGSSPLVVRVSMLDSATAIAEADIPAESLGPGPAWVTAGLPAPVELRAGVPYQVLLTTSADTSYSAWAIERGDHYHFDPATYFSDGYGEYTTGSGWSGFDQPGGTTDNANADLQFLLR
jgi:hypothetical protein